MTSHPDDVIDRLRAGAATVPAATIDAQAVLDCARRRLRQRRRRAALGGVAGLAFATLLAVTVSAQVGLIHVETLTLPGGYQLGTTDPTPQTMREETARLDRYLLPTLADLQVTWYENSSCPVLTYRRGTFSGDGHCAGRPGERPFDTTARADLARVTNAITLSGVAADEVASANYTDEGRLTYARILRAGGGATWDYAYLYSPSQTPADENTALGPVIHIAIENTDWWFEKTPND